MGSGEVVNQDPHRPPSAAPSVLDRQQLRLVASYVTSSSPIIDVGCSNGTFLRHALHRFRLDDPARAGSYGVEVSEPNRAAAERAGVRVEATLEAVGPGAVVTMWHSAEHFSIVNLGRLWDEVRAAADADTRLIVCVPNGKSGQWSLFGSRWTYFDREAHYSQFSSTSLRTLGMQHGWTVVAELRTPIYGVFGALQSSINLLRPRNELYLALKRGVGSLTLRTAMLSALAAVSVAPLAVLMAGAELSRRHASVLTFVFRPS